MSEFVDERRDQVDDEFASLFIRRLSMLEIFKLWVGKLLTDTWFGAIIELLQMVLSLLSCVLYVAATYIEMQQPQSPAWMISLEAVIAIFFIFEFLLKLFVAPSRLLFLLRRETLIDVLSIVPALALLVDTGVSIGFFRILRGFRILRVIRGYRNTTASDLLGPHERHPKAGTVRRQVFILAFTIVSFIFIAGGIVHAVQVSWPGSFDSTDSWQYDEPCNFQELRDQDVPVYLRPDQCQFAFLDAVYFVVITVTTIGT